MFGSDIPNLEFHPSLYILIYWYSRSHTSQNTSRNSQDTSAAGKLRQPGPSPAEKCALHVFGRGDPLCALDKSRQFRRKGAATRSYFPRTIWPARRMVERDVASEFSADCRLFSARKLQLFGTFFVRQLFSNKPAETLCAGEWTLADWRRIMKC